MIKKKRPRVKGNAGDRALIAINKRLIELGLKPFKLEIDGQKKEKN